MNRSHQISSDQNIQSKLVTVKSSLLVWRNSVNFSINLDVLMLKSGLMLLCKNYQTWVKSSLWASGSTTLCCGLMVTLVFQLAQRKIQEILAQVRRQQQPKPSSGTQTPQPRRKWRISGLGGTVTESARRLDRRTDAAESGGRIRRQGVVMLISGVRGYQNPTKHLPLLVLLDDLSSVADKRPCTSKTPPTSPSCISMRMYFWGLPMNVTCPHMYTPLERSPPPTTGVLDIFFLSSCYTRNTKKK